MDQGFWDQEFEKSTVHLLSSIGEIGSGDSFGMMKNLIDQCSSHRELPVSFFMYDVTIHRENVISKYNKLM